MDQALQLQIVRECQNGDYSRFGELYDHFIKRIYNFIYYKTHHKETAEDLTSKTFTKALDNLQQFNPQSGSFSAWLYKIAGNSVIDHYRQYKTHADINDAWDLHGNADIERDLEVKHRLEEVWRYLSNLSAEQREIVVLRIWHEMPYKEISEVIGKSEDNCKMIFSRTIKKLRQSMPLAAFLSFIFLQNNL